MITELKGIKVGEQYDTNNNGKIEILHIESSKKVLIRFIDTGTEKFSDARLIRKGTVRDVAKSYSGSGAVLDCAGKIEGTVTREYAAWSGMVGRCYSKSSHKRRPSYADCCVSEFFKVYSQFAVWCKTQVGFGVVGFDLDKDLLVKGNKIYSEDTCVFLPQEINKALQKTGKSRGKLPIGVTYDKARGKYKAAIRKFGKHINIGRFETVSDAFLAYKHEKEKYLKELAEKWKGEIDVRAYNALMSYEVELDD